jgi:pimeloyl-ACP methyl ester carboxylesterase
MNFDTVSPQRPVRRRVVALHCSGAGASQWCALAEALGGGFEVTAPEHYGCEGTGPWTGEHAFTLADEAARVIALVDGSEEMVHLVGHSYGGGVALSVALARPDRIASMALYEPVAFHLLRELGEAGAQALAEIIPVAQRISHGVVTGNYRGSMAAFVDYWNGPGTWDQMRPEGHKALIRWAPKAPLDFQALIDDPTPAEAYRALAFPVLILRGAHGPGPTRLIADGLSRLLPETRVLTIDGAGHMGPMTHAPLVSGLIARYFAEVAANTRQVHHQLPRILAKILGTGRRGAEASS